MSRYVLERLLHAIISLLAVTVIVFLMVHLTGDPALVMLPEDATPEQIALVRRELGVDQPLVVQYLNYMADLLRGDLGTSMRSLANIPVSQTIAARLPATLELGAAAIFLTFVFGVPLGVFAGYWKDSPLDKGARIFAVLGQSAPPFWVGILLIIVFSIHLGWLPAGGRGGLLHLVLPASTMAWASIAGITRLVRSNILETLDTDYIRFCRIKGLSEANVVGKHALRNTGIPVMTFSAVITASLITGSVITETIFTWPGLGKLLIDSIGYRDLPVIQGCILVFALVYIVLNLAVDLLYAVLNPKVRVQ
jgi:peptide/nickel transport system permease protein